MDEEQFKVAGRKLAAHLADPEVEVTLTALTVYFLINLDLKNLTYCEICAIMCSFPFTFLRRVIQDLITLCGMT